jgi:hypothetical protein
MIFPWSLCRVEINGWGLVVQVKFFFLCRKTKKKKKKYIPLSHSLSALLLSCNLGEGCGRNGHKKKYILSQRSSFSLPLYLWYIYKRESERMIRKISQTIRLPSKCFFWLRWFWVLHPRKSVSTQTPHHHLEVDRPADLFFFFCTKSDRAISGKVERGEAQRFGGFKNATKKKKAKAIAIFFFFLPFISFPRPSLPRIARQLAFGNRHL